MLLATGNFKNLLSFPVDSSVKTLKTEKR